MAEFAVPKLRLKLAMKAIRQLIAYHQASCTENAAQHQAAAQNTNIL